MGGWACRWGLSTCGCLASVVSVIGGTDRRRSGVVLLSRPEARPAHDDGCGWAAVALVLSVVEAVVSDADEGGGYAVSCVGGCVDAGDLVPPDTGEVIVASEDCPLDSVACERERLGSFPVVDDEARVEGDRAIEPVLAGDG